MSKDSIQIGQIQEQWNASNTKILNYSVRIYHQGLNEHKLISSKDMYILQDKVEIESNKLNEKWEKIEEKRKIQQEKEANQEKAKTRTKEAQKELQQIENLLLHTLSIDNTVNWDNLKKKEEFNVPKPSKPEKEVYKRLPVKPFKNTSQFTPSFTLIEKLIKSKKQKKIAEFAKKYLMAVKDWENLKQQIERQNKEIDDNYAILLEQWDMNVKKWEEQKVQFYKKQEEYNQKIENLKKSYFNKDSIAVTEYCKIVLNNSVYPKKFPKNFKIEYNPANQILIVEYQMPSQECLPTLKEVNYIQLKKEFTESYISEAQLIKMYDNAIYQITLRAIYELFKSDVVNTLKVISFNGWVNSINKATGKKENKCILSIQVNKDEFMKLKLTNVDPKICFKNLKGIACSKLNTLTPIQPILQISKTDKRFIDSYNVAYSLNEVTNVAAMDWEDFEHLIREIFEKEFSVNGGEVKVTQASRDGGVDAIAFDPDPIRGGKIVIQAKRYTNTVGVSAVRDLYGTVVNEGATKGILVTTADYGPDAYEFARGKPLSLLSGSNLLHLLEKHNHHAKIDLKEAKKILSENK